MHIPELRNLCALNQTKDKIPFVQVNLQFGFLIHRSIGSFSKQPNMRDLIPVLSWQPQMKIRIYPICLYQGYLISAFSKVHLFIDTFDSRVRIPASVHVAQIEISCPPRGVLFLVVISCISSQ